MVADDNEKTRESTVLAIAEQYNHYRPLGEKEHVKIWLNTA